VAAEVERGAVDAGGGDGGEAGGSVECGSEDAAVDRAVRSVARPPLGSETEGDPVRAPFGELEPEPRVHLRACEHLLGVGAGQLWVRLVVQRARAVRSASPPGSSRLVICLSAERSSLFVPDTGSWSTKKTRRGWA